MKKEAIFIILIGLFLVTGCTQQNEGDTGGKVYIGGDQGLEISFVEGDPPQFVSDGNKESFDVVLLVKNVGEDDIETGDIIATLQNLNKDLFSLSSLSIANNFDLEGKSKDRERILEGDQEELPFSDLKYTGELDVDFDVEVRVDVCYEYTTKASIDLCLKRNPTQKKARDVCLVDNANVNVENSGAPVKITNVEQFPRTDNIRFNFDIETPGEIYQPETFTNSCGIDDQKENKLEVRLTSPSRVEIKCSKLDDGDEGVVELFSGKRTITCTIPTEGLQDVAFKERLSVFVDYVYKDSVSTSFTVEAD